MTTDPDPMLPGLAPPPAQAQPLETAVRRTLAALNAKALVSEVDTGKAQLAIELAQLISVKRASGRASTVGNDARVLMEILDSFTAEESAVDEELASAMKEWSERANRTPEVHDAP